MGLFGKKNTDVVSKNPPNVRTEPVVLGKKYKDVITGFVGIATVRSEYLYGCVRVILTADKVKDDIIELYFDEQSLVDLEGVKPKATATSGGSQERTPPSTIRA